MSHMWIFTVFVTRMFLSLLFSSSLSSPPSLPPSLYLPSPLSALLMSRCGQHQSPAGSSSVQQDHYSSLVSWSSPERDDSITQQSSLTPPPPNSSQSILSEECACYQNHSSPALPHLPPSFHALPFLYWLPPLLSPFFPPSLSLDPYLSSFPPSLSNTLTPSLPPSSIFIFSLIYALWFVHP